MWWKKRGEKEKVRNEETRQIRGKLATQVIELNNQTRNLEELMKAMLDERKKSGRT